MARKHSILFIISILLLSVVNPYIFSSLLLTSYKPSISIEDIPTHLVANDAAHQFVVGTANGPLSIDPVNAWDTASYNVISQVAETLFTYNLSDPDLPQVNFLAESYRWINSTALEIKLREGIYFHDGTPFNANAAEWNFNRILYLTNCTGTNTAQVADPSVLWFFPDGITPIIRSVSAVGSWNITITLNDPFSSLIDLLSFIGASMLSPTNTPATDFIDLYSGQIIGTGPFQYGYYSSSIEVYFTRWDGYWRGPAFFEEMIFETISDTTTLNNAMLSHSVDYILNPLYAYFPSFDADPDITLKRFSDDTGKPGFDYYYMGFNTQLYNSTWRKVMSMAINYTYMLDEILYGNSLRANSPISPAFSDAYNASVTAATFDIPTARTIMQSMGFGTGFISDSEWIAIAEGSSPFLTLNFTYNSGNLFRQDMYNLLYNDFKLLGIKLVEAVISYPEYLDRLYNVDNGWNKLNIWTLGWGPDYLDPYNILDPLFSPSSSINSGQVDDPWLNSMLSLAINTTDYNARMDIFKNIQWYLAESGYYHAPLYHPKVSFVHMEDLKGVPYNALNLFYAYPIYKAVPGPFTLSSDAGTPDDDGNFDLNWTASADTINYSVYRYSKYINDINGTLTLLASEITDLGLALSGYLDGTYYFIVVAHNEYGDTLSNCISVSVSIVYDHDLKVNLLLPNSVEVNNTYIVKAMVINNGINTETGVQLYLYLDGLEVNSTNIPTLFVGQNSTIQYNWTPSAYKPYNFTAYAPPVPLESYLDNNVKTIVMYVREPNFLDGLYIKHRFGQPGTFYDSTFSYTPYTGGLYNESFEIVGMITYEWQVDPATRIMSGGSMFGDGAHTPAWIYTNTSLYDTIPIAVDGVGDHNFYVARDLIYDLPGFGLVGIWELEDLTQPGGLAWYEKSTGILLNGSFIYNGGMYNYTFEFVDTNANFTYITFDHEIKVTLDVPSVVELDSTYLINATVQNNGLYDESGVEIFLYLDSILVNSITITNLAIGMSQTIQYLWTPTEYRAYNFTAIAPSVPSESYTDNNRITIYRYLIATKLFDGLFIKHDFILSSYFYTSTITYSNINGRLFYENWQLEYMGSNMTFLWEVDALTRVMTGGSYFGDGGHTPMWIFTNVSLHDNVPIGIFNEGDHTFYVARDLIYNLPGVGPIGVWELEDLAYPGGVVWYEKSTGILLNGTFVYGGGSTSYEFDFIDTNAPIETVAGDLPGDFILSSNAGSPDSDGNFDLSWTSSSNADSYSVYRYSGLITEINESLSLLADEIAVLNMALNNYADGTYYFIIVAHNTYGDTLSNCISVTVEKPVTPPGIPGYNGLLIIAVIGVSIALIANRIRKKS
jgi:peptide/nickel transport system substrate-binding protein